MSSQAPKHPFQLWIRTQQTLWPAYVRLMRLDKPIGILLLLWPTLWAVWIASAGQPTFKTLFIFIAGTVLMRSAGCVMNDVADRNFDGFVERTKGRPLATGALTVRQAIGLAGILSVLAFILVLQTNPLTVGLSIAALFLAASYPLTKRFFSTPQAYLGIAFGFGIPMAFSAITESIPSMAWWLLVANMFWTLAYDTAYAMVDRDDDVRIGIHSTALFLGRFDVLGIMLCYGAMLALLAFVGYSLGLHLPYYLGLATAACLATYHYALIRTRERSQCFKAFLHNNWLGCAIFMGLVADYFLYTS